jgi:antitoxin ParD1/3/4
MSRQSTLNVSLTAELQKYVKYKLDSGGYESASEVIRDGLRALQEREHAAAEFWAGVREKVAMGRRQVAEGRTRDGEQTMDQILSDVAVERPSRRAAKKQVRCNTAWPTRPSRTSAKSSITSDSSRKARKMPDSSLGALRHNSRSW